MSPTTVGPDTQKPLYLTRMIDITNRLVSLLGIETVKEKQVNENHQLETLHAKPKMELMLKALTNI